MNERQKRISELIEYGKKNIDTLASEWASKDEYGSVHKSWIRNKGMFYNPPFFRLIREAEMRWAVTRQTARDYAEFAISTLEPMILAVRKAKGRPGHHG